MSNKGKVVFIDSVHSVLWDRLSSMGYTCVDHTDSSAEEAIQLVKDFDGVVIRSKFKFTRERLAACENLKFIARAGSGLENIDLAAAESLNIKVFSSPEGNRDAVAEHAIGMLLMLLNRLKIADYEVRQDIWKRAENRGFELKNQTIGLIGYGVMGKAFAQRLSGFGIKVLAHDHKQTGFSDQYAQETSLREIQQQANIISLHMNFHKNNKYYINKEFIDKMNSPFYLINTARGFNVNTTDLVEALKSNKVLGACLDVLEFESLSFEKINQNPSLSYLKQSEKVILSPHIAGWTHESHFKLSDVLADKINNWIKG